MLLDLINTAIAQKKLIQFDYYTAARREMNRRTVEPYYVAEGADSYMLFGFDRWREDWRHFRTDRMQYAAMLDEVFASRSFPTNQPPRVEVIPEVLHDPEHPPNLKRGRVPLGFLDIETSHNRDITVIGIYRTDTGFWQLIGPEIKPENVQKALEGLKQVYTYNGGSFDVPVIRQHLGVDVPGHHDLMHDCRRAGLRGGLKKIEEQVGIARKSAGMSGSDALVLWELYQRNDNKSALWSLLEYNREDTVNLAYLREILLKRQESPDLHI